LRAAAWVVCTVRMVHGIIRTVHTTYSKYFGQRNCPKRVEFYSKNKFEELVHIVGFITRRSLVT